MFNKIDPQSWKADMPAFREKAQGYAEGTVKKPDYKGFSGRYGSYGQRDPKKNMLRLRMPAGRVTAEKLAFVAQSIRKYGVTKAHFTTCQTIQLHDLDVDTTCAIMESALDVGIVTMGSGGDFPRNTMCSPLSGVEKGENFDVLPYAEATGEYAMNFINMPKMPRKLKICFSNSAANAPHATFRDLGFVSRPDGTFDVYSAGGLGNNPKFGVKVAEEVPPTKILYYVKAMWLTFCAYGNYQNRGKARTRYMQEICGGAEGYKKAYLEKLDEVIENENLDLHIETPTLTKKGDGTTVSDARAIEQKQEGLYAVAWHPIGGNPDLEVLCAVSDAMSTMEGAEMRIAPEEGVYIVNLTGAEAQKMLELTSGDAAQSLFETSVSCIGASICQVGLRDSQALLAACVKAVREANLPDGALPQIHISGCPSSCSAHQIGEIAFRGAMKNRQSAFLLFVGGCQTQGAEKMGEEKGAILETEIPKFLVELGQAVAASGMTFADWRKAQPDALDAIAAPYLA